MSQASNPSRSAPAPDSVVASVFANTAAIVAELSNPATTEQVAAAIQRLALVQSLATAIQDAVNDLRAHATLKLAGVGAASTKLIETGDVDTWRKTVDALETATTTAQERLAALIALAQNATTAPIPNPGK